jgi:ferritin-like metal-binding protein YciE
VRTFEQVAQWIGRDALDADGRLVGRVAAVHRDLSGAPSTLEIDDGGVLSVPVEGCEEAGTAIRLPIADGPAPPRHDRANGVVSEETGFAQSSSDEVVERLKEAYALEGEGLARLEAMAAAFEDVELQHRCTTHSEETINHRTGVEERLHALGEKPGKPISLSSPLPKGLGPVELLREAVEFEQREASFYDELEALARAAGDTATADLAAAHRADELAAADSFRAEIPRIDSPA